MDNPFDKIHIRDLQFRCIIGIDDIERKDKQDVVVNLTLEADLSAACASVSRLGTSSASSISRHAAATAAACRSARAGSLGRQRLHGRKPDCSATSGTGKNTTFFRSGFRDGQDGRQYTWVDRTPYTKAPSDSVDRSNTACHGDHRQRAGPFCPCPGYCRSANTRGPDVPRRTKG